MGVLHAQELAGWRAPNLEPYPDPQGGEIVVFEEYFTHGFGVPVHPFLQGLCNYYEINICNLHPNSVLLVACFIYPKHMVVSSPTSTTFATCFG
jgi:hypothetical protein